MELEGEEKYGKELDVAVRAVHLACSLCQKVQDEIVASRNGGQVMSKDDDSPVTVADWSVQATVSIILSDILGDQNVSVVAEEDVQTLCKPDSTHLLAAVVKTVNDCLAEAKRYGLPNLNTKLETSQILEAISRCNSSGGPTGKHWVLDPIDGTLGFVRGDQYAVALALIDNGKVVIGVLGCPNYPMKKELVDHHYQNHQVLSKTSEPGSDRGCVMYAMRGRGKAWMHPLMHGDMIFEWPNSATQIHVSRIDDPKLATFCESVEVTNTNHTLTAGVAHSMGLRKKPWRVYSMVKYAAIARGDAEIFMKFASSGYKEKIWDHAAGVIIVEEAGGVVTDAGGRSLDFSKGVYLEGLDRGIVACSGPILLEKIIGAVYASWDSSNL